MNRKPLPPLIEGWIKALHDPHTSIWIRENNARELENISDRIGESLRKFNLERNRTLNTELEKKRRKGRR